MGDYSNSRHDCKNSNRWSGYVIFIDLTSVKTKNEHSKVLSVEVLQCHFWFISVKVRTGSKEFISTESIECTGNIQMDSFCEQFSSLHNLST